jgi:RNA polymerase sigma factor (sigma-70 family)
MEPAGNARLSRITTMWSMVCEAHGDDADNARLAQQQLLDRYGGAVRRYLVAVLRDPDAAADLFQDFACRLLKGDLRTADAQRGRFRSFVKAVLFHMIADHRRRQYRLPQQLAPDAPEPAVENSDEAEADGMFLADWRSELLGRAWAALAEEERTTQRPYHTVLRFKADRPEVPSAEMAVELSAKLGTPLTAVGVRQLLHRAREQFADLLVAEVEQSLREPSTDHLVDELSELGLLDYCRPALTRRGWTG